MAPFENAGVGVVVRKFTEVVYRNQDMAMVN